MYLNFSLAAVGKILRKGVKKVLSADGHKVNDICVQQ